MLIHCFAIVRIGDICIPFHAVVIRDSNRNFLLAAGLSRPSVWNPTTVSEAYSARVELILRRMASAEFLWRHLANL